MKTKTAWSLAWSIWTAAVVVSFGALEGMALRRRCLPTYSRTLAGWSGCAPVAPRGRWMPILFLAFWSWLTVHVVRYRIEHEKTP